MCGQRPRLRPKKKLGDFEFLDRLLEGGLDRLGYVLDGFGRDGPEFLGLLDGQIRRRFVRP